MQSIQKQPLGSVFRKMCSENMEQIYRRTTMLKCNFNEAVCNFIEITLCHGSSSVNLLHIFRTTFPKNTCGGIFLKIQSRLVIKQKNIQSLSACKNHSINLLDSWNNLWDTPNFIVPWSKRSPHFWAYSSNNLYQQAKNQRISSIHSWHEFCDLKDCTYFWPQLPKN